MYIEDKKDQTCKEVTKLSADCFMKAAMAMNDAIFILNEQKQIVYHNPAYEKLAGCIGESGLPFSEFERQNSKRYRNLLQSLHTTGSWTGEVSYVASDQQYWFSVTVTKVESNEVYFLAILRDITEYKRDKEKHHYLAYHDNLTGLPNRRYFLKRLKACLEAANKAEKEFALLFIDIDEFKEVNDRYSHHIGDELLTRIGQRLKNAVRNNDISARFGGDEFVLLINNFSEHDSLSSISQRILSILEQPLALQDYVVPVTASVGVSVFSEDAQTIEELLVNADRAMYKAKQGGKNSYCIYTKS
ncbi:diguanylate cyclase [Bacillus taeanensis]|uniref:GGDEF domain-containing protein n=1 Tax=Bacillus taeanensis TaxID=273032 RepID=A0A366XXR4_9BACI|nr:diguanylate cyclase [Bacillus taeanensis]RBW68934.1 hypothetical protein DS031_14480 [Bacillus taeanensis]